MFLDEGRVCGDRIECPYHGWRFDADGHGQNNSLPDLELRTTAYDVSERYGLIWIKHAGADVDLPFAIPEGYRWFTSFWDSMPVPLQLVVDNFTDVEHTGVVHWVFGYPQKRMADVRFEVHIEEGAVHCRSEGPQKALLPGASVFLGIKKNDRFIVDWTTRGSPLHACYRMYWEKPDSGAACKTQLIEVAYFGEAASGHSWISGIYFSDLALLNAPVVGLALRKTLQHIIRIEYERDRRLLVRLKGTSDIPSQYRWSRFDTGLVAQRKLFPLPEQNPTRSRIVED
jgi:vanillate O-demethylase monooxygenase subunit